MPRKHRIHYFRAFYHVMLRGNNQQNIFFANAHRLQFYHYLSEAHMLYDCKIHLFCLMTNHVHLVIEVGHIPLTKIMHNITSRYARYLNKQQNRKGYLFEGRYQAVLIQNEKYLLELCYYIHMNPLKAGITNNISRYHWSSHLAYNAQEKIPWLTTSFILELLKKHIKSKCQHYAYFIQDREKYYTKPTFCSLDDHGNLIISDAINTHNQHLQHNKLVILPLNEIANCICKEMQITPEKLISSSLDRHVVLARSMVTYFAHYRAKYQLIDIANYLERQPDSISKSTNTALKLAQTTPKIEQLMHVLEKKLST